jgi:hypothetical protein
MRFVDERMLYVGGASVFQIDRYFEYIVIPTVHIYTLATVNNVVLRCIIIIIKCIITII